MNSEAMDKNQIIFFAPERIRGTIKQKQPVSVEHRHLENRNDLDQETLHKGQQGATIGRRGSVGAVLNN